MITVSDDYFALGCGRCERFATPDCSTRRWEAGLRELRRICREAGLDETAKWGHPCYVWNGRNIAIIGALRDGFRLTFFNAALLSDPEGVLEKQGPNTQHAGVIRFATDGRVLELEPVVRAYLEEAIGYAEAGVKPEKVTLELELPVELTAALTSDVELADAFTRLTPARQRSYVINLNSAKKSETRVARIARFRDRIIAGKGALER